MKKYICVICKKDFEVSHRDKVKTCSAACKSKLLSISVSKPKIVKPCEICGKEVSKHPSHRGKHFTCGGECGKEMVRRVNSAACIERNKTPVSEATKEKRRNLYKDKGDGKTYKKYYGRHEHRVVAEQKLGRPLLKGEIVHHKDDNKLNNHPDNIHIFSSQSEHAKHHMEVRHSRKDRYDL